MRRQNRQKNHLPSLFPHGLTTCLALLLIIVFNQTPMYAQRQMEKLNRGVVAIYSSGSALVSWRIFGNDDANIAFNLYKKVNGGSAIKVNSTPITGKSNYKVSGVSTSNTNEYFVKPVINGIEGEASEMYKLQSDDPYIAIPMDIPADGVSKDNENYNYHPNDCSVADLDGDGDYEIIVKWMPSNQTDNHPGEFTGDVIFDAYTLEGEKLWRINLGKNIRAGAHYNPFMVYDLDGDGKAELAVKTAPGTKDATGDYISDGPAASTDHTIDYRNDGGMILSGPEYLTIFNGLTGEEMVTTYYHPRRHPDTENPTSDQLDKIWGDGYGNRVDRFLACIAYLDGVRPSLIMCRGYYSRTVLAAYDFRGGELIQRWVFDSMNEGLEDYSGQGNHQLAVADVDGDGKDEIVYGAMSVDDDGTGLYTTGFGHGDALHVSDLDPSHPGQEVFMPHESGGNGVSFRDAATGEILWQHRKEGWDVGRGVAFDIDPNNPGVEIWASDDGGVYDVNGDVFTSNYPSTAGGGINYNHAAWWDGDLLRELVDRTVINKWNYSNKTTSRLLTAYNYEITDNNSTKSNPCLSGDILGDWREEIIFRRWDNTALYILCTRDETDYGMYTLMHDPQYRLAIAWQNVGYNQPPHPSFFIGEDMDTPPTPNAIYIDASNPFPVDNTIPVLADITDQIVPTNDECTAVLPDFSNEIEVEDENYISFNYYQTPVAGTEITGMDEITVTAYVNDGNANNSNEVEFKAVIADKTAPVITKAFVDHTLRPATGQCEKQIPDYTKYIEATDNCSSDITVTMQPEAGTLLIGDGDSLDVTVYVDDNNGNVADTTFTVSLNAPDCFPASIDPIEDNAEYLIYPNPVKDILYISETLTELKSITIKSVDGKIVYLNTEPSSHQVNVTNLSSGVYVVAVNTPNRLVVQKVVKY